MVFYWSILVFYWVHIGFVRVSIHFLRSSIDFLRFSIGFVRVHIGFVRVSIEFLRFSINFLTGGLKGKGLGFLDKGWVSRKLPAISHGKGAKPQKKKMEKYWVFHFLWFSLFSKNKK